MAWGPRRVDLHISIRELSIRSGVNRGDLSKIERGRMVPTGEEYAKVMAVLDKAREDAVESGTASTEAPATPRAGASAT